jgi:arylsulfatase A-like enzyme
VWPGVLAALGLYLVAFLPGVLLTAVLARKKNRRPGSDLAGFLPCTLNTLIAYLLIARWATPLPRLWVWSVPLILSLNHIVLLTLLAVRLIDLRHATWSLLIASLAGLAALHFGAWCFLLDSGGHGTTQFVSVAWFVASLLLVLGIGVLSNRSKVSKALQIAVAVSLPIVLLALPWGQSLGTTRDHTNFILITTDTLRADVLAINGGHIETPNIARLAERGVNFTRAYSLAPWTIPSLDGLMSGRYPPGLTAEGDFPEWNRQTRLFCELESYWNGPDKKTVFERLKKRGFVSGAFMGNPRMETEKWLLQDADFLRIERGDGHFNSGPMNTSPVIQSVVSYFYPDLTMVRPLDVTRKLTRQGIQFLRRNRNRDSMLWVHYMDPHSPLDPPERYRTLKWKYPFLPLNTKDRTWEIETFWEGRDYLRSLYDGEVRYIDDHVGRILSELDRLGMTENSIICFSSDHGEELLERGAYAHGHTLFEEQVHVPLIIAGPGVTPRTVVEPVSLIDVLPTLTMLTSGMKVTEAHGSSLSSVLRGASQPDQPVFINSTGTWSSPPEPLQAVVLGDFKLIRGVTTDTPWLFNLKEDPGELNNLAEKLPEKVTEMTVLLDEWRANHPTTFDRLDQNLTAATLDEEQEEMLRNLGYLQ